MVVGIQLIKSSYSSDNLMILKIYHNYARIPQLLQVVDELVVGYTIILLSFKYRVLENSYIKLA